MRSRICRRTRPASGFMEFLRFGRFSHHQARSGRWPPRSSAKPPGRSGPSSSTRRRPQTGDFPGTRIERSWSPGGWKSQGFGPWTVKSGLLHVAPPFDLLAGMVTLRVHLDPVPETNAPLLIAPGSHRLGQIPEGEVKSVVRRCGSVTCLADTGDVWLYSTPILHCSEAARDPVHRRVLQVDFAAGDLPGGLTWLGV